MNFSPPPIEDLKYLRRPRNRWLWSRVYPTSESAVVFRLQRQRYRDVLPHFSDGAYVHKWWSWRLILWWGRRLYILTRWRERRIIGSDT
jgi:hypothetical protein